ncbi:hypothetical protein [Streptomyces sp. SID13031]|uniref:hypothetical protein n=1 Tax=Streptomyces sp. SID13031 TaxID=2706046 RepID=UPI0013CBC61D|nr:hypothetical protein [Streptomyces sp. SID13031]NEA30714.1 hypothetical protein [Streptomyces sp. SID13031]
MDGVLGEHDARESLQGGRFRYDGQAFGGLDQWALSQHLPIRSSGLLGGGPRLGRSARGWLGSLGRYCGEGGQQGDSGDTGTDCTSTIR